MSSCPENHIPYRVEFEQDCFTEMYGELTRGENTKNVVIASPGLGTTVEESFFISSLREQASKFGNFSLFALDHPGYGMNQDTYFHELTLPHCVINTRQAIATILADDSVEKIILAGNSLGFWSLFQAICYPNPDPRTLALFGKGGVSSYNNILSRMLYNLGYGDNPREAWKNLWEFLNYDKDTEKCSIKINGENVLVDKSFFWSITSVWEKQTTEIPVECWHGELDNFTTPAEIKEHNCGSIIVHEIPGVGHSLSRGADDDTPHRVHSEMISRMGKIFEDNA